MSTAPIDHSTPPVPPASPLAEHDALPPGTRFGEFEILSVLGVGGFGIVYLANDHSLDRRVALKEYMPGALASRGEGAMITVRSKSHLETYAIGLRSFVNEARLLARFDHPSLVKVYRFWEDNATAYMVMPFLQGTTLRDTRRAMSQAPDEAWIRSVMGPLLGALEQLHREGVYHRDIAPDNVLLLKEGPPVLLDFGAARRVISDRTQSLTAILKPSYAPIEQYADMTQMRQGPWTDLYALGAVIHYLLIGVPPAPATARAIQDDVEPIEQRRVAGVSPRFMEVVAWMLALRPNQRPQSVAALREVLEGHGPVPFNGTTLPQASASSTLSSSTASASAATTLAITPHMPTELVTTPHVAPSTFFQSASEFDTVAQRTPAVEPPMPQTYAPSVPMPTARQAPTGATTAPPVPARPAGATANTSLPRDTRPAAWPATPAAARSSTAGASSGNAPVIRQSHTGLWIFSGLAAAAFAALIGWSVMSEMGTDDAATASSGPSPSASSIASLGTGAGTSPSTNDAANAALAAALEAARAASAQAHTEVRAASASASPAPEVARVTELPAPNVKTPTADTTNEPLLHAPIKSTAGDIRPSSVAPTSIPAPLRSVRPTTVTPDRTAPRDAVTARPSPTPAPVQQPATTAATPDRTPIYDRAPTSSRSSANSVTESAVNAGTSLGTPASRARQQGTAVPPLARPTTPMPTQAQVLDQSLTGRPVPTLTPAPAVTAAAPATAREACGKRVFIALALCMEERCEEARYRNGAECVKIIETKRGRENQNR